VGREISKEELLVNRFGKETFAYSGEPGRKRKKRARSGQNAILRGKKTTKRRRFRGSPRIVAGEKGNERPGSVGGGFWG